MSYAVHSEVAPVMHTRALISLDIHLAAPVVLVIVYPGGAHEWSCPQVGVCQLFLLIAVIFVRPP